MLNFSRKFGIYINTKFWNKDVMRPNLEAESKSNRDEFS